MFPRILLAFLLLAWLTPFCSTATVHTTAPIEPNGERRFAPAFRIDTTDDLPVNRGLYLRHYPVSNEARLDLFQSEIEKLGGGYVGVGTDQNFCFIGLARSRYAWLMDFDPVVVAINKIHLYFIEISDSYEAYQNLWHPGSLYTSWHLVQERFGAHPDFRLFQEAWRVVFFRGQSRVWTRLRNMAFLSGAYGLDCFNTNPGQFNYVRGLIRAGRVQAVPGDLRGQVTLQEIAKAARALGVKIRVFYPSNAEDYWRSYGWGFRQSILALPVDKKSLVIRTSAKGGRMAGLGFPAGEIYSSAPFHYNVQSLKNFQAWLEDNRAYNLPDLLRHATLENAGFSRLTKDPAEVVTTYPY